LNPAAIAAFTLAVILIIHHRIKHHHNLKGWRRWFQLRDVDNHETFIIGLIGFGAGVLYASV